MKALPPLLPRCIFREDFRNPAMAAANGLVITGNPWNASGVKCLTGTQITVPGLSSYQPTSLTIIADIDYTSFTGQYRTLFHLIHGNTVAQCGLNPSTNQPFWYDSGARLPAGSISTGRRILAWSCNGTIVTFFSDGYSIGFSTGTILRFFGSNQFTIGSTNTLNSQIFNSQLYSFRIYNYAMSSDEIRQDYLLAREMPI